MIFLENQYITYYSRKNSNKKLKTKDSIKIRNSSKKSRKPQSSFEKTKKKNCYNYFSKIVHIRGAKCKKKGARISF